MRTIMEFQKMNIDFKILWIDDDDDFPDTLKDEIEDTIERLNLAPSIEIHKEYSLEKAKKIGNTYDLILVDYLLKEDKVGTEIISKIRNGSLLPDIIFYSSVSTIEEIMIREDEEKRENLIHLLQKGIYFSTSNDLATTTKKVIMKITSREEKINGFRGIVLSFVSDYENAVNEIIQRSLEILPSYNKIKEYIVSEILTEMSDKASRVKDDFYSGQVPDNIKLITDCDNRYLDHNKRVRIMNQLLNILGRNDFKTDDYINNVLKLRNSLGHISITSDGTNEFYTFLFQNKIVQLTPDYCSCKRRELNEWKKEFNQILSYIKSISESKK
jgi:CheY-like chemotaxis protein